MTSSDRRGNCYYTLATLRESLGHTARMKLLHTFTLVVLVEFLAGCASLTERTQTDAPDGFYIETTGTDPGLARKLMQLLPR